MMISPFIVDEVVDKLSVNEVKGRNRPGCEECYEEAKGDEKSVPVVGVAELKV